LQMPVRDVSVPETPAPPAPAAPDFASVGTDPVRWRPKLKRQQATPRAKLPRKKTPVKAKRVRVKVEAPSTITQPPPDPTPSVDTAPVRTPDTPIPSGSQSPVSLGIIPPPSSVQYESDYEFPATQRVRYEPLPDSSPEDDPSVHESDPQ
jgi:hypothetical protein